MRIPLAGLTLLATIAHGQGLGTSPPPLEKSPTPIDVSATPSAGAPNTPIQLRGRAANDGKNLEVKLSVTPPHGPKVVLTAKASKSGDYQTSFNNTKQPGNYAVLATSPDGTGKANTSFVIAESSAIVSDGVGTGKDLISACAELEAGIEQSVASAPKSPALEELNGKLQQLKSKLTELPPKLDRIGAAWGKLQAQLDAHPKIQPLFQQRVNAMQQIQAAEKDRANELRRQLQHSAHRGIRCDELDGAAEGLSLLSAGLDLWGKWNEVLRQLAADKAIPENVKALEKDENVKFGVTEGLKFLDLATREAYDAIGALIPFSANLAAFAGQKMYGTYCERFRGPMKASLHAEFFDHGKKYWTYDEELTGRLTLRYAKAESAGEAIHFSGEYEGNGTHFELWDDFMKLRPGMAKYVLYHRDDPPRSTSEARQRAGNTVLGAMTRGYFVRGNYFNIPVEGDFIKDKITVNLLNPVADLDDTMKGEIIYIFVAPGAFIPETVKAETPPYPKAQWVISRAIGMKPDFVVSVDGQKKISTLQRDFTRDAKGADGSYAVHFQASVEACNPECK